MAGTARVAILVETSTGWGRRLIRGITNYVNRSGPWHLWVEPRDTFAEMRVPAGWPADGVIARVRSEQMARELKSLGVPVVNVSGIELQQARFPQITTNYAATAHLAAQHFIERGFKHFAYIGPLTLKHVARHAEAFRREVASLQETCSTFDYSRGLTGPGAEHRVADMERWLKALPRPTGIFCWALDGAILALERCREIQISVPDEIAVLAGDDDPLLCNITTPTLSGLVVASEQIGFQAAQRLDRLMHGGSDDGQPLYLEPVEITTRGSTDALAITDPELGRAIVFMRQNAFRPVTVEEIAAFVPLSRRSLERKFNAQFGRSPLEELRRIRLARARQLLTTTEMSIAQIAEASGFGTPEYMTLRFRQETGTTPNRFRTTARAR